MNKKKKSWSRKKLAVIIVLSFLTLLYLIASWYITSDSYTKGLEANLSENTYIDDISGEIVEGENSAKVSFFLLVEEVIFAVPIILSVVAFAWAITKITQISKSKKQPKPLLKNTWVYFILIGGMLFPLLTLKLMWYDLFPPQCDENGIELGGPENCIIGASFGGIIALPIIIVSASFFVALIYKIARIYFPKK